MIESSLIKNYKEKLTNELLKSIEEKGLSWTKEWFADGNYFNYIVNAKGKHYNLLNTMILNKFMVKNGYKDPRFFTFKNAKDAGYSVKKGAKSIPILTTYPMAYMKGETKAKTITWEQFNDEEFNKENKTFINRTIYYLFNAEQLDGIKLERIEIIENKDIEASDAIKKLVEGMGVGFKNDGGDEAYYSPKEDSVHLPLKETFKSSYGYNHTALHELAHSTGHEKRLNRDIANYSKDIKARAKEELVAEITSAYMGLRLNGLDVEEDNIYLENHKAYINGWGEYLKDDKELVFKSFREAEKAEKYMMDVLENSSLSQLKAKHMKVEEKEEEIENEEEEHLHM